MFELASASLFVTLGLIHSIAGEAGILKPLFAAEWEAEGIPRYGMERILRFAWHATSFAWLGIAAVLFSVSATLSFAMVALLTAAMVFVMLRGHLAWPICLVAGIALIIAEFGLPTSVARTTGLATSVILILVAVLHVYWACGGPALADSAYPTERMQAPGPAATLAVAALLTLYAGLVAAHSLEVGPHVVRWGVIAGVTILTLRAVGDGKYIGFSKQVRESKFGQFDDAYFTPLVVALAIGASSTLFVG